MFTLACQMLAMCRRVFITTVKGFKGRTHSGFPLALFGGEGSNFDISFHQPHHHLRFRKLRFSTRQFSISSVSIVLHVEPLI